MKKNLTELVFVLDMSGSMSPLTDDTIGGFNTLVREHREGEGEVLVSTYLFNNESRMVHDRRPIGEVGEMTRREYTPCGCTALMDAMGEAIKHIAGIHRYAREEDRPEHTIFVITTDGLENASTHYRADEIRKMVKHEQEKYGWEFIFLAANIDAAETAEFYGIRRECAVDIIPDAEGIELSYGAATDAIRMCRVNAPLADDTTWREKADMNFSKRSQK